MFWFYVTFNSPTIYDAVNGVSDPAMTWSATALWGAVDTVIMILATLAEFSYIPTTWNNTSNLTRRVLFLSIVLALTRTPTFYVSNQLALRLGTVQFFISIAATLLFTVMPSGRMFGNHVAGKSSKYLASQTFMASYPSLRPGPGWHASFYGSSYSDANSPSHTFSSPFPSGTLSA
ncbi:hypothetical protein C8J56DRAFT_163285 [Mycena floridula]|nr:hypothetical protein C8J56DRAFT_163285 [Mycena floridula]